MQFQVPQFIETEDKIVGPLTLKQFMYVAIGAIISFVFFFMVNTFIWFFLAAIFMGGGAALAFVKVEGRSLPVIMVAAIKFFWKPQQYVWQESAKTVEVKTVTPKENSSYIENIVAGFALKRAWQTVQTGSKAPEVSQLKEVKSEKYEVFRGLTGEKRAARRVDYR